MNATWFRAFKVEDMVEILGELEPGQEERHLRTARTRVGNGPSYTFLSFDLEPRIIACCGVTIFWEGMGEVWLATSSCWSEYPVAATVWARRMLDFMQSSCHLRRIQADVVAANATACRFVEHFGFTREGLMKCYDVIGRDCYRYARVRALDDEGGRL